MFPNATRLLGKSCIEQFCGDTVMADIDKLIKEEFPLDPDIVYLNHAAVSPWPSRTARAVAQFAGGKQQIRRH